jgi:hypothetical protein
MYLHIYLLPVVNELHIFTPDLEYVYMAQMHLLFSSYLLGVEPGTK